MRLLLFVFLCPIIVVAQEPDRAEPPVVSLKEASKQYELELKEAKDRYRLTLNELLKIAASADDQDEIKRIQEELKRIEVEAIHDEIAVARKKIEGTRWTWTSKISGPHSHGLRFLPDAKISFGSPEVSAWTMVEPYVLVMRIDEGLYLLEFDEKYTRYKIKHFKTAPHNILPGQILPGKAVR